MKLTELFKNSEKIAGYADILSACEVTSVNLNKATRKAEVFLSSDVIIPKSVILDISGDIKRNYNLNIIKLFTRYPAELFSMDYYTEILYMIEKKHPHLYYFVKDSKAELKDGVFSIYLKANGKDVLYYNDLDKFISGILRDEFQMAVTVEFIPSDNPAPVRDPEEDRLEIKRIIEENARKSREESESRKEKNQSAPREFEFKRKYEYLPVEISMINAETGRVKVKGEIFKIERKDFNNSDRGSLTFYITDYKNSVMCRFLAKKSELSEAEEEFKKGDTVEISGETMYDKYIRDFVVDFKPKNIEKAEKKAKKDNAEKKRVELHLHTSMSAIDGINPIEDYVKRAKDWGHTAIAITDHGVVQAFPDAYAAAKKAGVKLLFGVEGYLVDDRVNVLTGQAHGSLKGEFVVFDIETTGLSPINDKITEIGACRIKDGKITDRFSTFVNPGVPIPPNIVKLTNITDEMVADAPDISEVMPEFIKFINNAPLVAHNAGFDTSFIKANCVSLNIPYGFAHIDTLTMARVLLPDLAKHKLNNICDHLKISLEGHHRAVNDAEATAEMFIKFIDMCKEKGISEIERLNSIPSEKNNSHKGESYHVIILVKNRTGLKNLYKLVSIAHIDHFYRNPRMLKSEIDSLREGLIIGSACEAGELYRAVLSGKSQEDLLSIVDFYDFLEVQPLGNNQFMLENGAVSSEEELAELNKKIIELGDIAKKPVVATGDVHFLDETGGLYRAILMSGKKFKDVDNQPPLYYRTTEEMLDEFKYLSYDKAYEIVVTNTNLIADMIEDDFPPVPPDKCPPVIEGAEDEIKELTYNKAYSIYGDPLPEIVQKRIEKELNSIINNGFSVMYLIAQKLVHKTNSDGFLVGSRGSVGSSFVAFLSGITEVNSLKAHYVCKKCKYSDFDTSSDYTSGWDMPDKYCPVCGELLKKDGQDIPFETFLGFEGDKEPDIDLNFAGAYQPIAHKYIEELFGEGHVFRAGTIGTIAEKTAFGYVKKYFEERGRVLNNAETDRLVIACTGAKNTTGQHPGGVIIVPKDREIYEFTPVQHPANDKSTGIITTHFDYHKIDQNLLKLDILGHDDPAVLKMLEDLTGLKPTEVPMDDKDMMSLFLSPDVLGVSSEELGSETGTFGIPEFGTKFVRGMLKDIKPKTFGDLVRTSGYSHGTDVWLGNAQELIQEGIPVKDTISTRDDIMLYLINYGMPPKRAFTIMEQVRKGKGLKDNDIEEMHEHNVPQYYIDSCLKVKYLFPKAHAVAYVTMGLRVAYYKVHYPLEYYCAYYTVRGDDFDAAMMANGRDEVLKAMSNINSNPNATAKEKNIYTLLEIVNEMYLRGFDFLPIDLYKSEADKFTIEDGKLRPPFTAVKGLGLSVAESIVEERKNEFFTKEDFISRTKAGSSIVELLTEHGCFKDLPDSSQTSFF